MCEKQDEDFNSRDRHRKIGIGAEELIVACDDAENMMSGRQNFVRLQLTYSKGSVLPEAAPGIVEAILFEC